jgi:hypothetical protein
MVHLLSHRLSHTVRISADPMRKTLKHGFRIIHQQRFRCGSGYVVISSGLSNGRHSVSLTHEYHHDLAWHARSPSRKHGCYPAEFLSLRAREGDPVRSVHTAEPGRNRTFDRPESRPFRIGVAVSDAMSYDFKGRRSDPTIDCHNGSGRCRQTTCGEEGAPHQANQPFANPAHRH